MVFPGFGPDLPRRPPVSRVLGGDPQFFYLEHKNILRNLETAKDGLRRLIASPQAGRRQAHEFLDQESMLLHLLEHHDLREKNILHPKLDEALSPDEREALLERCGLLPPPPASFPGPAGGGKSIGVSPAVPG